MEASGCFDDTLPTTNERDKKRHWVGKRGVTGVQMVDGNGSLCYVLTIQTWS